MTKICIFHFLFWILRKHPTSLPISTYIAPRSLFSARQTANIDSKSINISRQVDGRETMRHEPRTVTANENSK